MDDIDDLVDFDDLDELDIELEAPDEIGSRLVLLSAIVLWPTLTGAGEREKWMIWLKHEGVLAVATDFEIDLLKSPGPDSDEESVAAAEALISLAWTVGLIPEHPARSETAVVTAILDALPVPLERIEPFLNGLIQLDENVIAVERERAEIWNWRLSSEILRRMARGIELVELSEAIREVILEVSAAGLLPESDGTDFLVDGVPVLKLDADSLGELLLATGERLRALNWVCGLTDWDQVDIDD